MKKEPRHVQFGDDSFIRDGIEFFAQLDAAQGTALKSSDRATNQQLEDYQAKLKENLHALQQYAATAKLSNTAEGMFNRGIARSFKQDTAASRQLGAAIRNGIVDELLVQVASLKDEVALLKANNSTRFRGHEGASQQRSNEQRDKAKSKAGSSFEFRLAKKHRDAKPQGYRHCGYCADAALKAGTLGKDDMPPEAMWFENFAELKKHSQSCPHAKRRK